MESPDLYVPISLQPVIDPKGMEQVFNSSTSGGPTMGRIKPGVSDPTAQAGLDVQFQAAVRASTQRARRTMPRFELADGAEAGISPTKCSRSRFTCCLRSPAW